MDTVAHCGSNAAGLFACSFNLTDIASTWVETQAALGKSEVGIVQAFSTISRDLPFQVLDIDSDNGGEFINRNLYTYCHDRDIGFTRSRPYKKDDNAHIEQKNWTPVRKIIGWDRYDTPEAVAALNDLYANELRLYMNLFQPSVKLIRTVRKGSRKTRHYDQPQTPLDRLAAMPKADPKKVEHYLRLRESLDPFDLIKIIQKAGSDLETAVLRRKTGQKSSRFGERAVPGALTDARRSARCPVQFMIAQRSSDSVRFLYGLTGGARRPSGTLRGERCRGPGNPRLSPRARCRLGPRRCGAFAGNTCKAATGRFPRRSRAAAVRR